MSHGATLIQTLLRRTRRTPWRNMGPGVVSVNSQASKVLMSDRMGQRMKFPHATDANSDATQKINYAAEEEVCWKKHRAASEIQSQSEIEFSQHDQNQPESVHLKAQHDVVAPHKTHQLM